MKKTVKITMGTLLLVSVLSLMVPGCARPKAYTAEWKSLKNYPVPEWYDNAKFGIMIHWGPYSVAGWNPEPTGYAEWYPRSLYHAPKIQQYHEKTFGPLSEVGYKDLIPMFKAEKWDPQVWADLFANAGARYVVPGAATLPM